jgi:hypothetical protein
VRISFRAEYDTYGALMKASRYLTLLAPVLLLGACAQGANGPAVTAAESAVIGPAVETPATASEASATTPAPASRTQLQKLTFQLGPYELPAKTSAEGMREVPGKITFHVDEPLWITSFEPHIESGEGHALPGALLHLAIVSNRSEENPLCSSQRRGNPFAAATSAMRSIDLPEGHGYAVLPEDTLEATVVLQNDSDESYRDVYFRFTLSGVPMKSSKGMGDLTPLLLDVDPCHHKPLAVEPGGFVKRSERFAMPEAGSIVSAYGLLQSFGVEVALAKESDGAPFWKAATAINDNYEVTGLPAYRDATGVPFESGDGIVLTVSYQNFSEAWFNDATTAAMVYLARTGTTATTTTTAKPYRMKRAIAAATEVQSLLAQ